MARKPRANAKPKRRPKPKIKRSDPAQSERFIEDTLPCHHAYVVVSAALAKVIGTRRLAFGYAGYQSTWPEQTPQAVSSLRRVLARYDIVLELPVYSRPVD
jgi:hypothetical protein